MCAFIKTVIHLILYSISIHLKRLLCKKQEQNNWGICWQHIWSKHGMTGLIICCFNSKIIPLCCQQLWSALILHCMMIVFYRTAWQRWVLRTLMTHWWCAGYSLLPVAIHLAACCSCSFFLFHYIPTKICSQKNMIHNKHISVYITILCSSCKNTLQLVIT